MKGDFYRLFFIEMVGGGRSSGQVLRTFLGGLKHSLAERYRGMRGNQKRQIQRHVIQGRPLCSRTCTHIKQWFFNTVTADEPPISDDVRNRSSNEDVIRDSF